jgi:GxxExxY protein
VHKVLGPGLPEAVYQRALAVQLSADGLEYEREKRVGVDYAGTPVGEFHLDFLVEDAVIVELKALEDTSPVHLHQVNTYIAVLGRESGLLLNFGRAILQPRRVIPPRSVQANSAYAQRVRLWKSEWAQRSHWVQT